jgi:hypothetical protein
MQAVQSRTAPLLQGRTICFPAQPLPERPSNLCDCHPLTAGPGGRNVSIMPLTPAEMAGLAVAIFALAIAALVWFRT